MQLCCNISFFNSFLIIMTELLHLIKTVITWFTVYLKDLHQGWSHKPLLVFGKKDEKTCALHCEGCPSTISYFNLFYHLHFLTVFSSIFIFIFFILLHFHITMHQMINGLMKNPALLSRSSFSTASFCDIYELCGKCKFFKSGGLWTKRNNAYQTLIVNSK